MKRFRIVLDGQSYDVEVGDPTERPLQVVVDGETFHLEVEAVEEPAEPAAEAAVRPAVAPRPASPPAQAVAGPDQVTAPMPGKVLDLSVSVGNAVETGQTLCALEAMKMKSPIRALRPGTVREILVREGQTVAYGAPLFVIR